MSALAVHLGRRVAMLTIFLSVDAWACEFKPEFIVLWWRWQRLAAAGTRKVFDWISRIARCHWQLASRPLLAAYPAV
jgi:hypothetical protein